MQSLLYLLFGSVVMYNAQLRFLPARSVALLSYLAIISKCTNYKGGSSPFPVIAWNYSTDLQTMIIKSSQPHVQGHHHNKAKDDTKRGETTIATGRKEMKSFVKTRVNLQINYQTTVIWLRPIYCLSSLSSVPLQVQGSQYLSRVEPCLVDTPQQRTYNGQFQKFQLSLHSLATPEQQTLRIKDSFCAPYFMQTILNDCDLVNTR